MAAIDKRDPNLQDLLRAHIKVDAHGNLKTDNLYVGLYVGFRWQDKQISIPYSHLVWFLTHGRWPNEGYRIDHINDNPVDNSPTNLQELTHEENQAKRRGRRIYRSYGSGKYGYGLHIYHDLRDNRYYLTRHMSRGHGGGDLKNIKKSLGGFDTHEEAEAKIKEYIREIESLGTDHIPSHEIKQKRTTIALDQQASLIRSLREQGHTLKEIAKATGFSEASIYNKTRDIDSDQRKERTGERNAASKLTEEQVREIRRLYSERVGPKTIAERFNISRGTVYNIVDGKHWSHVT